MKYGLLKNISCPAFEYEAGYVFKNEEEVHFILGHYPNSQILTEWVKPISESGIFKDRLMEVINIRNCFREELFFNMVISVIDEFYVPRVPSEENKTSLHGKV